jgi:hypothetical protein
VALIRGGALAVAVAALALAPSANAAPRATFVKDILSGKRDGVYTSVASGSVALGV